MAEEIIGTDKANLVANQGATVRPRYGERSPVMYHLFENELDSISGFNAVALTWFSIGSFFVNMILAILIGYAFATLPLTELGDILLHKVTYALGALSLMCFGGGTWAVYTRKSITDKIKKETISTDKPSR